MLQVPINSWSLRSLAFGGRLLSRPGRRCLLALSARPATAAGAFGAGIFFGVGPIRVVHVRYAYLLGGAPPAPVNCPHFGVAQVSRIIRGKCWHEVCIVLTRAKTAPAALQRPGLVFGRSGEGYIGLRTRLTRAPRSNKRRPLRSMYPSPPLHPRRSPPLFK